MKNVQSGVVQAVKGQGAFVRPGKFVKAGKQPFFRTFADQNFSFGIEYQADAAVFFLFGRFGAVGYPFEFRQAAGQAFVLPGTEQALGIFRRADHGAQIHDRRSVVCRMLSIGEGGRFFADEVFDFGNRGGQMMQPADDADDVAVDDRFRQVEGESEKACRRIGADTF